MSLTILLLFFLLIPPPPRSTLFPYTTLFRSSWLGRVPERLAAASHWQVTANPAMWFVGLHETLAGTTILDLPGPPDRKSTRLNSSHLVISYAVFCLKKKIK